MQELSGVSEAARDLAMARFRLIQPYLEERRSLQLVAADANLSFRTAQRWVSQLSRCTQFADWRPLFSALSAFLLQSHCTEIMDVCSQIADDVRDEVCPRFECKSGNN